MSARLLLLLASLLAAPCALAGDYLPDPELVARDIAQQPEVRAAAARGQRAQARMRALGSHELEVVVPSNGLVKTYGMDGYRR